MRDVKNGAEFTASRLEWLNYTATQFSLRFEEIFEQSIRLDRTEVALLLSHIGEGHRRGFLDNELVIPGFVSASGVQAVISKWRSGSINPVLARFTSEAWATFLALGSNFGVVRDELATAVRQTSVGRTLREGSRLNWWTEQPGMLEQAVEELLQGGKSFPAIAQLESILDCSGSHLSVLYNIAATDGPEQSILEKATPLEIVALIDKNDDDEQFLARCHSASRELREMTFIVPGAWPGSAPDNVPQFIQEIVLPLNGRSAITTTGDVASLLLITESDEERTTFRRFAYEPLLSSRLRDDSFELIISARGDVDILAMSYIFSANDPQLLRQLATLAVTEVFCVDFFSLDSSDRVVYDYSFALDAPQELVNNIIAFLQSFSEFLNFGFSLNQYATLIQQSRGNLLEVRAVETARFDLLTTVMLDPATYRGAFDELMTTLISAGESRRQGIGASPDRQDEARMALMQSVIDGRSGETDVELPTHILGSQRAIVYVDVKDGYIYPLVYYIGPDGPMSERFDCSGPPAPSGDDVNEWLYWLTERLRPLSDLKSRDIRYLVISPSSESYNLPFHDALLDLGFEQVSYAPNLRLLSLSSDIGRTDVGPVLVEGFAGTGSQRISAVDLELGHLRNLFRDRLASNSPSDGEFCIAHFSSHGFAGNHAGEHGLALGPSQADFLSGARVLRDFDLANTNLVFLSACETGQGRFEPFQVQQNTPLDTCFLAAGASVTISTSRAVNDRIAFFFSAVFHELLSAGEDVWDAYARTRKFVSRGIIPPECSLLQANISGIWPTWQADLDKARMSAPADWRVFRISGRFWN